MASTLHTQLFCPAFGNFSTIWPEPAPAGHKIGRHLAEAGIQCSPISKAGCLKCKIQTTNRRTLKCCELRDEVQTVKM